MKAKERAELYRQLEYLEELVQRLHGAEQFYVKQQIALLREKLE